VVVDQLLEVLVNFIHPHIQVDARKPLIIFVHRNHASDHALEVLGIFVSDGLITIDFGKYGVDGMAMVSRKDHQIVDVTRLHAIIDDDAFHD